MILLIDNYDSFSYNLYQYIGEVNEDIRVIRNDEATVADIRKMSPARIVISPGPGSPRDAGVCVDVVRALHKDIPILGICLGHQAIFEAFGGTVTYAGRLMHGKPSTVLLYKSPLFAGIPTAIQAGRYHSLAGAEDTLPPALMVTATTEAGDIMAVAHREYPTYGVQFHPESILTPHGKMIIKNFIL